MVTTPPPEIAAMLTRRRHPSRQVPCPHCRALAGRPCRNRTGGDLGAAAHPGRMDAWATTAATCPACSAVPGAPCREGKYPYGHGAHSSRVEAAHLSAIPSTTEGA